MRRREVIGLIGVPAIWPMVTRAQGTTKIARVGVLLSAAPGAPTPLWNQCLERLRLLGWERGRNLIIEARYGDSRPELLAAGAAELVALSPDLIVAGDSQTTAAALVQTSSIPIVMVGVSHPVEAGFIKSLASSGSNVTGLTNQLKDVDSKALGLLREAKPGIDRVGVLYTPRIAALLIEGRVPTVTAFSTWVRDGILMSYGPDLVEMWRDTASYIDRILRGARPGDLPVQQPTKFLFVINLRTAKAIGVDFSPTLLARADEVIE